jgi:hypothetical protein
VNRPSRALLFLELAFLDLLFAALFFFSIALLFTEWHWRPYTTLIAIGWSLSIASWFATLRIANGYLLSGRLHNPSRRVACSWTVALIGGAVAIAFTAAFELGLVKDRHSGADLFRTAFPVAALVWLPLGHLTIVRLIERRSNVTREDETA